METYTTEGLGHAGWNDVRNRDKYNWFSGDSDAFFATEYIGAPLHGHNGDIYFRTAETGPDAERKFSARVQGANGATETIGDFHVHDTALDALRAIRAHYDSERE